MKDETPITQEFVIRLIRKIVLWIVLLALVAGGVWWFAAANARFNKAEDRQRDAAARPF